MSFNEYKGLRKIRVEDVVIMLTLSLNWKYKTKAWTYLASGRASQKCDASGAKVHSRKSDATSYKN